MKNYLFLIFLFISGIGFGQIPNADFEEWEIGSDGFEKPIGWFVINSDSVAVKKIENGSLGSKAMKILNKSSRNFKKFIFGVAYTKFFPDRFYDTLSFTAQIDTLTPGGRFEFIVSEKSRIKIGYFETEYFDGIQEFHIPLRQTSLDSIFITIWSHSVPGTFTPEGRCEIIVDNFQLSEGVAPLTQRDTVTICEGEAFNFKDTTLTTEGNHALFYTNASGADSLYLFNLTILEHTQTTIDTTLAPNSFFENTLIQNDTTIYKNLTAANGCDSLVTIHIMLQTTSVENTLLPQTIQLFPNPAQDKIQIEIKDSGSSYSLCVYNLMGQIAFEQSQVRFSEGLDVNDWQSGVYVFRFEREDGVVHAVKMVKTE